jgi:ABC-type multidrug transport system fused ATPase/permease subunit
MAKRKRTDLTAEEKRPLNKTTLRQLTGVFRYMLPYRTPFIFGLLSLALSTGTILLLPILFGQLLDAALGTFRYFSSINQVALALMVVLFVQSIFSYIRVYTFAIVSEKGIADIRKGLFNKVVWLPLSFFDRRRVGEIMSRMTSDVSTLQDTFSFTLAEFIRQFLTLLLGTIFILVIAPSLTVFMLLTFPVIVILAMFFGKFIRKLSRQTQDKLAETNVILEESLHTISVVKAFVNELFETNRYNTSIRQMMSFNIRTGHYRAMFISFIIFAVTGGIVAVAWYGATLVQSHAITHGVLFSFIIFTTMIGLSIQGLGDLYAQIQRSVGASERVLEILNEADEQQPASPPFRLQGTIAFEDVSFVYPTRLDYPVLKDLNFVIRPGEKVALVGRSGSGKSTIVNLLMRFYEVEHGKISVDGVSVSDYNLSSFRQNIGIVPQEVILFGGTILENIAYGKPDAPTGEIMEAARKANALEFIESFPEGFSTLVGERGVKLSGGQRQRIAIARAILKDPAILILDEATSALDSHSEVLVQQALELLMKDRTSIIIAHRLSTIKKVDRIFVINEGRLAETGSHAELSTVDNGIYSNLVKLQLH